MYQLFLARMSRWQMPGWLAHILQRGVMLAVLASQPSTLHPASLIVNFEASEVRFGESSLPIGSSIFVVAPTGTEAAFYASLGQVSSAGAMASFLSNTSTLKFYNSEPVNYGSDNGGSPDDGTFRGWLEGDLTPGGALIGTSDNTATRRLFLLISTSANSSFDSTTSFLLLRQRASPNGIDAGVPIDSVETPFFANVSPDATTGMDVIFGQFFSSTGAFQMSGAGAYGQITSDTTRIMNTETTGTYQILSNNGANSFGVTSLPTWASLNSVTGVITLSPGLGDTGTFTLSLSAANTITGKTATGSLIVTVQAGTGPSFTSIATATATEGVDMSYPITTDAPSTFTAITALPSGLTLNSVTGVLSGIPRSATTSTITIRAARTANAASFTDQNLVLTVSNLTLEISALVSGQLTRRAGTAHTIPVTIPAGFTVDSYTLQPAIPGVSYSAGNLFISSTATPFAKGTTKESLTLTFNRTTGLNGAKISASLTFDLRLEAPTPRLLTTRGPFEVTVGDDYSLQLLTDVSTLCPNQNFRIVGTLPPGLALSTQGLISGVNRSTSSPDTYETRFAADTTQYEGGGVFISPPVTFLLRNNPPVISSASRAYTGVLHKKFSYTLQTDTDNHVDSEILGVLPPGVVSRKSGLGNSTIILEGYPTESGIYKNILVAKNYLRPGNTSTLQETSMELVTYVFGKNTSVKQELNSAALTTLIRGVAIDTNTPLRLTSGALSEGTYVVASSTSFRPISRPNDQRYEFLPGILLNPFTGIISGTPTTSGTFQVTVSFMNARKIEKTAVTLKVR